MSNVTRIEIFKAEDVGELEPGDQWYYNALASNGEVVVTSEMYVSRSNAERAATETFPDAEIAEEEGVPPAETS